VKEGQDSPVMHVSDVWGGGRSAVNACLLEAQAHLLMVTSGLLFIYNLLHLKITLFV
jgi:hypothetical protein